MLELSAEQGGEPRTCSSLATMVGSSRSRKGAKAWRKNIDTSEVRRSRAAFARLRAPLATHKLVEADATDLRIDVSAPRARRAR